MDYRILGPLEVVDGDRPVALGADRQRAVLAELLLRRNEVVASERLIDELWGEHPPPTAAKILQNYVSRLRRALGANGGVGPLETHGRGYRLRVEPGALDLERFERCLESGRGALAAGDPERAAAEFRAGLGMWRGPPLPELTNTAEARVEIDRILERRVIALEGRVEADLALGRHAELIGELEAAGDVTPANVAVYRIDPPGVRGDPLLPPDLEGASIDRVITPSPELLRYALNDDRVG